MAVAVGIDLGTTNTVVGVVRDGVAAAIGDPDGYRLIPSVVSFHPSGQTLVGRPALDRRLVDAPSTIYSVKRLIGRPWGSPEVEAARGKLPFELREGQGAATQVVARGEPYSLPEISAFVLRQAKAVAEAGTGEPVERAVITVPANFNDLQRAATKIAGKLAGLEVLRILNEPTAAALAYGPQGKEQERIAVFDLGGGTFDVTVLDLAGNVFEVLATAGDTALGGDDIDVVVAERMADDLLKKHRFDARAQPMAFGRLRILAEAMKRALSSADQHTVSGDDIVPGDRGKTVPWSFRMTRPELEWASLGIVERTFKVCQQALDAASLRPADLDRVILVGGATRMPMVGRKVEQFFGRPPVVRINPDEVVALGAAIQAALLDRARQKTAGPMQHPRIDDRSVVAQMPTQAEAEAAEGLVLPVVSSAKMPAARKAPDPVVNVAETAALPGQLLPGAGAKPLVFDLPAEASSAPFELELPRQHEPSRPKLTVPGAPPPPVRPRLPTMQYPYQAPGAPPPAAAPPEPVATPVAPAAALHAPPPAARAPAPPPPRPAPLLIDVTPHSLGVETVGGFCDMLIDANTPVPCDRTRSFATAADNQTTVRVRIAQGESKRFAENTCLGEVELAGIQPAPRGATQISVTFEIDADGILNVRAKNVATGQETAARIQLVGAQDDPAAMAAMAARQAAHPLAPLG
ncbi:MAG TPA: Hsp70 family protein [Polyangiaceae bacterium]